MTYSLPASPPSILVTARYQVIKACPQCLPGRATAIFEVNLKLSYSSQGNTLPDEIKAYFADDRMNYSIECSLVAHQLLTGPPAMG